MSEEQRITVIFRRSMRFPSPYVLSMTSVSFVYGGQPITRQDSYIDRADETFVHFVIPAKKWSHANKSTYHARCIKATGHHVYDVGEGKLTQSISNGSEIRA